MFLLYFFYRAPAVGLRKGELRLLFIQPPEIAFLAGHVLNISLSVTEEESMATVSLSVGATIGNRSRSFLSHMSRVFHELRCLRISFMLKTLP